MRKVLYLEDDRFMFEFVEHVLKSKYEIIEARSIEQAEEILSKVSISLLLSDLHIHDESMIDFLGELKQNDAYKNLPIVVLTSEIDVNCKMELLKSGVSEYITKPFVPENLDLILQNVIYQFEVLENYDTVDFPDKKLIKRRKNLYVLLNDFTKRIFDIVVSSILIILLSPLLLLIAAAIRIESKGNVIYSAKRVGRYYAIFPFYKFRSMRVDADSMVSSLQKENAYNKEEESNENEVPSDQKPHMLYSDKGYQVTYKDYIKEKNKSSFFKLKNDPRVTKVGALIRKTSLDELPQLFNVLFGHMSIVGNRPLPIYEAEQMTKDKSILRFSAPAGITGLWQVEKSKRAFMTIEERIELDTKYARKYNIFYDIGLMLKTIPAMIQKEE
ncbi:sugar transferase [Flammeovirga sp. OC4]|uniref:sugar transferase n=1 Tax=Flammeovirga sp. OC4 TaxID=1382345 RepID=UPI0006934DD3|nr:sugar transferase [Flammeovirga sp. OC4]